MLDHPTSASWVVDSISLPCWSVSLGSVSAFLVVGVARVAILCGIDRQYSCSITPRVLAGWSIPSVYLAGACLRWAGVDILGHFGWSGRVAYILSRAGAGLLQLWASWDRWLKFHPDRALRLGSSSEPEFAF